VELSPEGMEWEPAQRHLNLGQAFGDQVVWLVSDKDGHIIDGSKQAGGADFLTGIAAALPLTRRSSERVNWNDQPWQCGRRWLITPPPLTQSSPRNAGGEGRVRGTTPPQTEPQDQERKYP